MAPKAASQQKFHFHEIKISNDNKMNNSNPLKLELNLELVFFLSIWIVICSLNRGKLADLRVLKSHYITKRSKSNDSFRIIAVYQLLSFIKKTVIHQGSPFENIIMMSSPSHDVIFFHRINLEIKPKTWLHITNRYTAFKKPVNFDVRFVRFDGELIKSNEIGSIFLMTF